MSLEQKSGKNAPISRSFFYLFWLFLGVAFGLSAISDCDLSLFLLPYDKHVDFDHVAGALADPASSEYRHPGDLGINQRFKGEVVWITGASSGIGAYLAMELTRSGAQVVLSARREDKLSEVARNCSRFGLMPMVLPLDVTQLDMHAQALSSILKAFGRLDSLVLNAGKSQRNPAVTTNFESTRELFELNFFSVVHLNKLVLDHFISNNKGHVVVISSVSGHIATPIASSYSATKFALHGYFDALRNEVTKLHKVKVTLVCPGPVESEIALHTIRDPTLPVQSEGEKMRTSRCAFLTAKAMYYEFGEAWISTQPVLLMTYISVYFPWVSRQLMTNVVGPARIKTLKTGGNVFDIGANFGTK